MKHSSDSRIVFALVGVLFVIVVGVITIQLTKTITGTWVDLGGNVGTFLATIGGGILGVCGAYVTNTPMRRDSEPAPEFAPVEPADATPAPPPDEVASDTPLDQIDVETVAMSADEHYGGIGHAGYVEISEEELDRA